MKGLKNEKYTKVFMIALGILAVSILLLAFVLNFDYFKGLLHSFLSACKPVIYALLIVFCVGGIISAYKKLFLKLFKKCKSKETLSKIFSVALGYLTLLVVLAAMLIIVVVPFVSSCAKLVDAAPAYIDSAYKWIGETLKSIPFLEGESDKILEYINGSFTLSYDSITEYAPVIVGAANRIISEASNLLIGFIISIYIVISSDYILRIRHRLVHALLSEEKAKKAHSYTTSVYGFFTKYFSGRVLYAIIVWIVFYLSMWVLGIEFYSVISLIIAALTFVPVVGTVLAFGISVFFVLIASYKMLLPFVLIFIGVMLLGKILLQPRIIHTSVRASLTASTIAVLAMYGLFGTVGAIVAVPVYLSIKLLLEEILSSREAKKEKLIKESAEETEQEEEN